VVAVSLVLHICEKGCQQFLSFVANVTLFLALIWYDLEVLWYNLYN
jgi:hypothetical protein